MTTDNRLLLPLFDRLIAYRTLADLDLADGRTLVALHLGIAPLVILLSRNDCSLLSVFDMLGTLGTSCNIDLANRGSFVADLLLMAPLQENEN